MPVDVEKFSQVFKSGVGTSEFWLTIITLILGILQKYVDTQIPTEAFITVIVYIISRLGVKMVSNNYVNKINSQGK